MSVEDKVTSSKKRWLGLCFTIAVYILIWIIGIFIIAFFSAFNRAEKIENIIRKMETDMSERSNVAEILSDLTQILFLADLYPGLGFYTAVLITEAYISTGDIDKARKLADEILEGRYTEGRKPIGIVERLIYPFVCFVNNKYDYIYKRFGPWIGYELLVGYMKEKKDFIGLSEIATFIMNIDSKSPLAQDIHSFLKNIRVIEELVSSSNNIQQQELITASKTLGKATTDVQLEREIIHSVKVSVRKIGIVKFYETPYYSLQGKYLGELAPGDIMEIIKITKTSEGEFAVVNLDNNKSNNYFAIRTSNINIFEYQGMELPEDLKGLLQKEARLEADIARSHEKYMKELERKNPFYDKFVMAKKSYFEFSNKVRDLIKERDNTDGTSRQEIIDQLWQMKYNLQNISKEYHEIKEKFDRWNSQNLNKYLSENPEVKILEQELISVKAQISTYRTQSNG